MILHRNGVYTTEQFKKDVEKLRKLKRLLKRMFPNRIIKVTDNPDISQTISIL